MKKLPTIIGKRDNQTTGFTLLEVLISITLLVVVLGAIYSTFFMVQRAVSRFEKISLKYQEARTILDMIRREIESVYIKKPQNKDITLNNTLFLVQDRDIFNHSASSIYFTSFPFRDKNLHIISYSVERDNDTLKLLKMDAPAVTISTLFSHLQRIELMDGIEGFSVEMLLENSWVKTWDSSQVNGLPARVRISILIDDNGEEFQLTEYAQPRIGNQL